MAKAETTDDAFLADYSTGNLEEVALRHGLGSRQAVINRFNRIKARQQQALLPAGRYPHRQELKVKDGTVIVFSDCHWWPGQKKTTAHAALIRTLKETVSEGALRAVIANGDLVDAARINRHPSIGWESKPHFADELSCTQDNLGEIEEIVPGIPTIWDLGNHDMNFETQIANKLPMMERITGMHLKDHFPAWIPAWSTWINGDVVVKHRFKGGEGAPLANTKAAGLSVVTGHLHSANVVAFTDYRGTRYGADTGCLAIPISVQFVNYTEDNPLNWRSAFGVLTFRDGVLLRPELVEVLDEEKRLTQFRGQVTKESK